MPALIAKKNRGRSPACIYSQDTKGHKIKIYPAVELANVEDKEAAVLEDTKKFSGFIERYIQRASF